MRPLGELKVWAVTGGQKMDRFPCGSPCQWLMPRPGTAKNLLVPARLSASHFAFGSVRLQPTQMPLGTAASMPPRGAARRELAAVQDVDVRERLASPDARGQVVA